MSDVSDPEDEMVEFAPEPIQPVAPPPTQGQGDQRGHGHSHCRPAQTRQYLQKPPGADKWPAVYTTYLNIHRTKAQVHAGITRNITLDFASFRDVESPRNTLSTIPLFTK